MVKLREFTGHTQAIYALASDTAGRAFFSAGGDGMLVRWQMNEADGVLIARTGAPVYSIAMHDDWLLAVTAQGILHHIALSGHHISRQIQIGSPVFRIIQTEEQVLLLQGNGKISVLNRNLELQKTVTVSSRSLRSFAMTSEGLVVSGSDGILYFLDQDFTVVRSQPLSGRTIFSMAYDPSEGDLYCGGLDAMLYRVRKDGAVQGIAAHMLHIHDLDIQAESRLMLSSSMDKTIKIWKLPGPDLLKVIDAQRMAAHTASVNKILWFDKNKFISCADDRRLMSFEIRQIQT